MKPFSFLPDWMQAALPAWAPLALLTLLALLAVAILMVPFALLGLRGRLDLLEAQLDDIQAELRNLALNLADAVPEPVAPRVMVDSQGRGRDTTGRVPPPRPTGEPRSEPQLRWPPAPDRR